MAGAGYVYPLKISSGKHYPVDQRGVPFFMVGDAAWSGISALSLSDWQQYLDDRLARGVNTVGLVLIDHTGVGTDGKTTLVGDPPFTTSGDWTTPNSAYFAVADNWITEANLRNMVVVLAPAYLGFNGGNEGWEATMLAQSDANMTSWGNFLGSRYAAFKNIVWVQGGDRNPPAGAMGKARLVANGIIANDLSGRLHTAWSDEGESAFDSYGAEAWLNINNTYDYLDRGAGHYPVDDGITEYGRSPVQPSYLHEGRYEGEGTGTQQTWRQQAWESMTGGGFGHIFGNGTVWNFLTGWQTALSSTGIQDLQKWRAFFQDRAWHALAPDSGNTFLTSGLGSDPTRASAALASDGSWGCIYIPTSRSITIAASSFMTRFRARWYDPTAGTYQAVSGSPFPNTGSVTIASTPGNNAAGDADWILIFELDFSGGRILRWSPSAVSPVRR